MGVLKSVALFPSLTLYAIDVNLNNWSEWSIIKILGWAESDGVVAIHVGCSGRW